MDNLEIKEVTSEQIVFTKPVEEVVFMRDQLIQLIGDNESANNEDQNQINIRQQNIDNRNIDIAKYQSSLDKIEIERAKVEEGDIIKRSQ